MSAGNVLVYGGKGALGRILVTYFKSKQFWTASIDLAENEEADANVVLDIQKSWTEQEEELLTTVPALGVSFDAIFCVAGGWAGGKASTKAFIKNADLMWRQSVWSSALAARIATKVLKEGGLLTLTGAKPCLEGTPGMLGYGMAKAAVHQLTTSLADPATSGLPAGSATIAILPVTLDTPMNRKWMPEADTSTWTSLDFIAELFHGWTEGKDRPKSGSLMQVVTTDGKTEVTQMQ